MSNLTVLMGLIIKGMTILLPLVLLYLIYRSRKSWKRLMFLVPALIALLFLVYNFYKSAGERKKQESVRYLGYYKLDRLNGENCDSCKLNLVKDQHYDIIVNNQIVGTGKWDLGFDGESAGFYLMLENGPTNMIFDTPREIQYIDTRK